MNAALVSATSHVIAHKGLAAVWLRGVAEAAGMTSAAVTGT